MLRERERERGMDAEDKKVRIYKPGAKQIWQPFSPPNNNNMSQAIGNVNNDTIATHLVHVDVLYSYCRPPLHTLEYGMS